MEFIKDYWWIIVILLLVGVLMNVYKDLKRIDHKKYMANKPDLPPHRDFNDKWDDEDDWPKKKKLKRRPNAPASTSDNTGKRRLARRQLGPRLTPSPARGRFYTIIITSSPPGFAPLNASSK